MTVSRRSFMKFGLAGAAVTAGGLTVPFGSSVSAKSASDLRDENFPVPFTRAYAKPPELNGRLLNGPRLNGATGQWDVGPYRLFTVVEQQANANILPGLRTPVYGYGYVDDSGVKRAVRVPGPTINVNRGESVKLRVINRLPKTHPQWGHEFETSTHLHGSASLPQYDGYADDCTGPGQYKDYWYPNFQGARTLWYHDHGVHHTAMNAYGGLAAQYHLHDAHAERTLPAGAYDLPLTITDAHFSADGKLAYDDHEFSGLWGDVILVNGVPWPYLTVKPRVYRFRVLNACLGRSFRFHLNDNGPFTVVGTDGGLMPAPVVVNEMRHGQGERYEILIDFSRYAGKTVRLMNRSNRNNVDYDHTNKVMEFRVTTDTDFPTRGNTTNPRLPALESGHVMAAPVNEAVRTRRWELDHDDTTNVFSISDKTWHDVIESDYKLLMTGSTNATLGTTEIWEFENNSGGWFHPLHVHLTDFRILSRNGQAAFPYEAGPKDVVYIGEDETVRLLVKFDGAPGFSGGKYMVHCHNLPHEDHDMMQQFGVGTVPDDDHRDNGPFCAPSKDVTWPSQDDGVLLPGDTA